MAVSVGVFRWPRQPENMSFIRADNGQPQLPGAGRFEFPGPMALDVMGDDQEAASRAKKLGVGNRQRRNHVVMVRPDDDGRLSDGPARVDLRIQHDRPGNDVNGRWR